MTISIADLKFFQSERMTQEGDAGGRMSGIEIQSGTENGIFDDISDVARAVGSCHLAKVYAAVQSPAPDKYLDAGVVVFTPPDDEDVSVLAFSTGNFYDERTDQQNALQAGVVRGGKHRAFLWGNHTKGNRGINLWQRLALPVLEIGARLEMVAVNSITKSELYSQTLWITRVQSSVQTFYESLGLGVIMPFDVRLLSLEITEGLHFDFEGCEPAGKDDGITPYFYYMRYAPDALSLNGIAPLKESAAPGNFSVQLHSLYSPLIPTSFKETALPDVVPNSGAVTLVRAHSTGIAFVTTLNVVGANKSLYLGSGCLPGSLGIGVTGSTVSDRAGAVWLAGAEVGAIDYSNGVVTFNSSCPNFGTSSKTIAFTPAAPPTRCLESASQVVTLANRGFVWVLTLAPIPQPQSLQVAYRANNEWYVIADQGDGNLSGTDASYGSGRVDFTTGTVTLTTGALPDAESEILYSWSTAVNYTTRGGQSVAPMTLRGTTANQNVIPGTVAVSWVNGASTFALSDETANGELSGDDGKGFINYQTGAWWLVPSKLPAQGTEFNFDYEFGAAIDRVVENFDSPALGENGKLTLTLNQLPKKCSLAVTVAVDVADYVEQTGTDSEDIGPNGVLVTGNTSTTPTVATLTTLPGGGLAPAMVEPEPAEKYVIDVLVQNPPEPLPEDSPMYPETLMTTGYSITGTSVLVYPSHAKALEDAQLVEGSNQTHTGNYCPISYPVSTNDQMPCFSFHGVDFRATKVCKCSNNNSTVLPLPVAPTDPVLCTCVLRKQ